jgi:1-aminocyclopropane-1-carboxylate deaminase/D-cysteine desulfhydrase-like pyridoxal-dependent ACC family enzyme
LDINQDFFKKEPVESLAIIQSLIHPLLTEKNIFIDVKREDLMHPYVSGNKWRKLKYNVQEAKKLGKTKLLTFGGAYSNHIYATAAAGTIFGFETIGIIRGDEFLIDNETLRFAEACGMKLKFISRTEYRLKNEMEFISQLEDEFGEFYFLPEGGTNGLAIKGCEEIVEKEQFEKYDAIALMVGTGGTFCGILNASNGKSSIIGISALKGSFLKEEIENLKQIYHLNPFQNYSILDQYHHGGYAKKSNELELFMDRFEKNTGIPLEHVYTGKLFYALFDLVANDFFKPGSRILAIHTGGLRN